MKKSKILALVMTAAMIFTFAGCGSDEGETSASADMTTVQEELSAETPDSELSADPEADTEEEAAEKYGLEMVNVVPQLKAGGSFATAAYAGFEHPTAVERIQAHAGIDIGDTFIGMHLRPVAVPVRTSIRAIGGAHVTCARTRLKYIGGERAHYLDAK